MSYGLNNGWITNGSALPQWLQYQFPSAVTITSYRITPWSADNFPFRTPTSWILKGSTNGSTWVDLDTHTGYTTWTVNQPVRFTLAAAATYAYFRLHVTANGGNAYTGVQRFELEGAGVGQIFSPNYYPMRDGPNLSPPVAANTDPSPFVAFASTAIDGFRQPYKAFDAFLDANQYWMGTGAGVDYVGLDIGAGNATALASYTVVYPTASGLNVNMAPKNWVMQGSLDNSTWTILDTVTNETGWSAGQARTYVCDAVPAAYRYFRMNISANNGNASNTVVGELRLFEGVAVRGGQPQPFVVT
jgi:hypothetical protein